MTSIPEVVAYFQGLVDQHRSLKTLIYGDADVLLAQAAKYEFPILYLEDITLAYDGPRQNRYRVLTIAFTVAVRKQAKPEGTAAEALTPARSRAEAEEKAAQICEDILFRYERDFKDEPQVQKTDFSNVQGEAVMLLTANNEIGMRVEFKHRVRIASCGDQTAWE